MPQWLIIAGVALSSACILVGMGLLAYAIGWAESDHVIGSIGGAIGCVIGGAGGLFGTLCDHNRRLPATIHLQLIHNDQVNHMYRVVFWPAVFCCATGLFLGFFVWNNPVIWHGIVQVSGILLFCSGSVEAARRHSTFRARAAFALYADGALLDEDTKAIDDARAKSAEFDAEIKAYLQISQQLSDWATPETH